MNKNMIVTGIFLIGLMIATVFIFLTGGNPLQPVPIPGEQGEAPINTPITVDMLQSPMPGTATSGEFSQGTSNADAANIPDSSACASSSGAAIQTCCANWAQDNGVSQVMCVGEWQISSGSCSFVCN